MINVVVSYRVLQAWRVPVFERLAAMNDINLTVLYSEDFNGSKVKSAKAPTSFKSKCLRSINFQLLTSNGKAFVPFCPSLFFELLSLKPDIIISEGASNFINNFFCFIYAKFLGCKILQWGLGEISGRRLSTQRRLLNLLFIPIEKNSDGAICYSSLGAEYYQRIGMAKDRIFTAVNVVDTERRLQELKDYCKFNNLEFPSPVPDQFRILFIGAITFGKQIELLIEAYQQFSAMNPSEGHSLTIVGDGDHLNSIKKKAAELDILHRISFPGHVSSEISEYFYDASIFVLPGLGGLAVSDALTHGLPVICTIGDGCERDLVKNGINGYFISHMTVEILANQLNALYRDKITLARLRQSAQKFPDGPYTINSYVKQIKYAIDACLK
jgi:glycosyltransferase involved in cell wall biosynthesis